MKTTFPSKVIFFASILVAALYSCESLAWGDSGHEIIANIAYSRLSASTKAKVDAILAADQSTLTQKDFASRATWADKYRDSDRNSSKVKYNATREWHFADVEIDLNSNKANVLADLNAPCHDFPTLPDGVLAAKGPKADCVISKVEQFETELKSPNTHSTEKLLALKFIMHFVGDLHQPLHCADHNDRGGNSALVLFDHHHVAQEKLNLHHYWDTELVDKVTNKKSPAEAANILMLNFNESSATNWEKGTVRDWALESTKYAKDIAYQLQDMQHQEMQIKGKDSDGNPTLKSVDVTFLNEDYKNKASVVVKEQLQKAGVRLAEIIERSLGQ